MNRKLIFTLIVALLACLALPAGWAAADPGDTEAVDAVSFIPGEPNNTFATATPWESIQYYDEAYFLTPTDLDYYRITLASPAIVEPIVYLSSEYAPTPLRVELAFYNASQAQLAADTDCSDPAELSVPANAGIYYLRLKPCAGTFDIDRQYQLQLDYSKAIEWEPNNTLATANDNTTAWAAIAPAGDVDFFNFEAEAGMIGNIQANLIDGSALSPRVVLMDATGKELVVALAPCAGCDVNFDYTPTVGGTYYVSVTSATPGGVGEYIYQASGFVEYIEYDGISEVEPNNLPSQATTFDIGPLGYRSLWGEVAPDDPVDYFRFAVPAGNEIAFGNSDFESSLGTDLALYDSTMNPVPLNGSADDGFFWTGLLAGGDYTLKVAKPADGFFRSYYLFVALMTGDEPENNLMATATPVLLGQQLTGFADYTCDVDWYRFQGRAGDVFPDDDDDAWDLYDAGGNFLEGTYVLPSDGTYYLKMSGWFSDESIAMCVERGDYYFTVGGRALWVSADYDGLGGNTAIKQQDIVTRDTAAGKWQIVFDASDVGITKDVTAFETMPNGSILMSLDAGQNVSGLGWVAPQDIIRFVPATLGWTTSGTFQWYLDGSDVGLTTADEKIDAIYLQPYADPLRISTFGSGSVPRQSGGTLNFADEDLINFVGTQYGATSAGKWRMNLDGSTIPGMGAEDLNAVARVELAQGYESPSLFVMRDAYSINGVKGGIYDVLSDRPAWRLVVQGLADKKIDGLAIGPAWMP